MVERTKQEGSKPAPGTVGMGNQLAGQHPVQHETLQQIFRLVPVQSELGDQMADQWLKVSPKQ